MKTLKPYSCVPDFGSKPSPRRRAELEKLHPAGLTDDWADKLAGRAFYSHNQKATFEHYLQARPGAARVWLSRARVREWVEGSDH